MQERFIFRTKWPRRADHEIGPDQTPRLIINRPRQAVAKRTDAHQRRDPERDRDGKQEDPSPARPAVPPSHFPDEGRAHVAISETLLAGRDSVEPRVSDRGAFGTNVGGTFVSRLWFSMSRHKGPSHIRRRFIPSLHF